MACGNEVVNKIEQLNVEEHLNCPICFEVFHSPRALSCLHTFCEQCIQSYILKLSENGPLSGKIVCPTCRGVTVVTSPTTSPSDWAQLLPLNYTIIPLLESLKIESNNKSLFECASCNDSFGTGTAFCLTCDGFLCRQCTSCHGKAKAFKEHNIVDSSSAKSSDAKSELSVMKNIEQCISHPEKKIECFCEDHKKLLCCSCLINDHRACNSVFELKEALLSGQKMKQFKRTGKRLVKLKAAYGGLVESMVLAGDAFKVQSDEITKTVERIKSEVCKKLDEVDKVREDVQQKYLSNLSENMSCSKRMLASIERYIGFMKNSAQEYSIVSLFILSHKLHSQINQIENEFRQSADILLCKPVLKLHTSLEEVLSQEYVGSITLEVDTSCNPPPLGCPSESSSNTLTAELRKLINTELRSHGYHCAQCALMES